MKQKFEGAKRIPFDRIKGRHEFEYDEGKLYAVTVPSAPVYYLFVNQDLSEAALAFNHPNLLHKVPAVFEFKHHHPRRGKYWTSKAGVRYLFALDPHDISLIEAPGFSYVPIQVGKAVLTLNASGGTSGKGWDDWLHIVNFTLVQKSLKLAKEIAEHAGVVPLCDDDLPGPLDEQDQRVWLEAYYKMLVGCLEKGMPVRVRNHGPFVFEERMTGRRGSLRQSAVVSDRVRNYRVRLCDFDWTKTAELNGLRNLEMENWLCENTKSEE